MRTDTVSNVPATLALGLGLWAAMVGEGARAGVFLRLPFEVHAALAAFAIGFALAAVTLDRESRHWLERPEARALPWLRFVLVLLVLAVALAMTGTGFALDRAAAIWPPVLLFGVPVLLALSVARWRARPGRSALPLKLQAWTAPARPQAAASASHTSARSAASAPAQSAG